MSGLNVVEQSRKWLGVSEVPPGSNCVPGLTDTYPYSQIGCVYWCAIMVSKWYEDAGTPLPRVNGDWYYSYVPSGHEWARNHGELTSDPQPGDIFGIFDDAHTGIFVEWIDPGVSFVSHEGNTATWNDANGIYATARERRAADVSFWWHPATLDEASLSPASSPVGPPGGTSVPGDRGAATSAVQRWLTAKSLALGLPELNPGGVDGEHGPITTRAVAAWQRLIFPGLAIEHDGAWGVRTAQRTAEYEAGIEPPSAPIPAPPAPCPKASTVVDVSEFQGDIDFESLRTAGVGALVVRAGDPKRGYKWGSEEDAKYGRNRSGSLNFALRGAYWFVREETDMRAQADRFAEIVRPYNLPGDLPPIIDFEDTNNPNEDAVVSLTSLLTFIERVQELFGRLPIIYTNPATIRRIGGFNQWLAQCPLWLAHYADCPEIPAGYNVVAWQWTQEGSISGVSGPVDLSTPFEAFPALGFLAEPPAPPAPEPPAPPAPEPPAPPAPEPPALTVANLAAALARNLVTQPGFIDAIAQRVVDIMAERLAR